MKKSKIVLGMGSMMMLLSAQVHAELIYGVTSQGGLISFDSATPGAIETGVQISGIQANEEILGIDFRPATGELFGVGSFNNLYTINPGSGQSTLVGGGTFSPALNGAWFGFDFNPTIDRIRNVSDANQNLVLNPNDGTSTGVTDLFYGPGDANEGADPTVAHSAYTNSFAGATTTQLYSIDVGLDILTTQANSAGTLGTVGPLGVDVGSFGGFDISGVTGTPYAALLPEGDSISSLYTVDLNSGNATLVGEIAGGLVVSAITVVPEPTSVGIFLSTIAMTGLSRRGRCRS